MDYNFDEIIDRRHTHALNTDGFRQYIFKDDGSMVFPYADEDFIRMWVADMEFATPEVIIDAIRGRLDRRIFGYTRVFEKDYVEAFSSWCQRRYQWTFAPEELVMSNGIIPALFELVDYLLSPDEKVIFFTPSYAYFQHAADYSHKEAVWSDLIKDKAGFVMDFEDFEKKASDPKVKLLILCNPHNPTGRVWTEEELSRLAEICQKNDLWVLSDEIHCDLLRKGQKHIPMGKIMPDYDKLITAMAPSKTFNMAGLMISHILIRNEDLRKTWLERHYNFDNPLSIAASQAAYEKGEDWLMALQEYLDENFAFTKAFLADRLPKSRFDIPQATYLAWVDVSAYFETGQDLSSFFAHEAGVLLEGGDMFVANGQGYIRLNLACPRSILETGLLRIAEAIEKKK